MTKLIIVVENGYQREKVVKVSDSEGSGQGLVVPNDPSDVGCSATIKRSKAQIIELAKQE